MEDLVIIWQNREQKEKETSQYLEQRILLVHLPPQEFQNISIQLAYHVAQEIHSYELQILQTTYEERNTVTTHLQCQTNPSNISLGKVQIYIYIPTPITWT